MRPPACAPKSQAPNQEPEPIHVFTDKNEGFCIIYRKTLKIEVPKKTKKQQRNVAQPLQIAAKIDCGPQQQQKGRIWSPSVCRGQMLAHANRIGFCQSEVTGSGWFESTIIIIKK